MSQNIKIKKVKFRWEIRQLDETTVEVRIPTEPGELVDVEINPAITKTLTEKETNAALAAANTAAYEAVIDSLLIIK